MQSITFDQFDVGLDRRKSITVSDANRLYDLRNAYVTKGKVIRKRPGTSLDVALETGTVGLISGNGKLNTFYESGTIVHANTDYLANKIAHPTLSQPVTKIHFGDVFNGYIYVAAEYNDGSVWHSYLDGTVPPRITDVNCPHTKGVLKTAERIWAVAPDVVRFTKVSTPRDWTTITEAGFIATGLRARGSVEPLSLGQYQERIAVFMNDSIQVWNASAAFNDITYHKPVDGVGCRYPRVPRQVSGDIMFLAKSGFRSVQQSTQNDNLSEIDVGSPVDSIVRPYLTDTLHAVSEYFTGEGQYWCSIPDGVGGSLMFVYTFSKTAKISAWSIYEFDYTVNDMASHNGRFYLRSGNNVYLVDESTGIYTDNMATYEMRAEFPFLDFKKPGSTKYISGMDVVVKGTVNVSFRYDPEDLTAITDPVTVTGDGRMKQTVPVEITIPAIAPIFTSESDELVQIDAFTFHYEELGVV